MTCLFGSLEQDQMWYKSGWPCTLLFIKTKGQLIRSSTWLIFDPQSIDQNTCMLSWPARWMNKTLIVWINVYITPNRFISKDSWPGLRKNCCWVYQNVSINRRYCGSEYTVTNSIKKGWNKVWKINQNQK